MGVAGTARRAVKVSAAALDVVRPPASGVVVLIYHRVGARTGLEVDLPVALFEEQLEWLVNHRRVVPLGDALTLLGEGARQAGLPAAGEEPVVVTFDDGTADFVDDALPVIERHRVPVTLYVATDFVESRRSFPDEGAPVSWSALAEALATGLVSIGSHTHTHRLLDRVAPAEAADELDRSIGLIGDRLGTPPLDFAYPKAVAPTAEVEPVVRSRFRSAALAGTRANPVGAGDPYRLARTPVQRSDGMRWFQRKVAGGMAGEDAIRRALNRRRYAGADT